MGSGTEIPIHHRAKANQTDYSFQVGPAWLFNGVIGVTERVITSAVLPERPIKLHHLSSLGTL